MNRNDFIYRAAEIERIARPFYLIASAPAMRYSNIFATNPVADMFVPMLAFFGFTYYTFADCSKPPLLTKVAEKLRLTNVTYEEWKENRKKAFI